LELLTPLWAVAKRTAEERRSGTMFGMEAADVEL